MANSATLDDIADSFSILDDWEDRYRYIIDLGRKLDPLPETARTAENKVEGCISQVWLTYAASSGADGRSRMLFLAASDAHIVQGLLAILLALFSGKTPQDILSIDADAELAKLDLAQHISPNRRNGVASVVRRIRLLAEQEARIAPSHETD